MKHREQERSWVDKQFVDPKFREAYMDMMLQKDKALDAIRRLVEREFRYRSQLIKGSKDHRYFHEYNAVKGIRDRVRKIIKASDR